MQSVSDTTKVCFLTGFRTCFLGDDMMVVHHPEGKQINIRQDARIQADICLLTF